MVKFLLPLRRHLGVAARYFATVRLAACILLLLGGMDCPPLAAAPRPITAHAVPGVKATAQQAAFDQLRMNGLPVYAVTPGLVLFTGYEQGLGQVVDIDRGNGVSTRYTHLHRILVHPGQSVAQHQLIGLVGDTGWNMWPNLVVKTGFCGVP